MLGKQMDAQQARKDGSSARENSQITGEMKHVAHPKLSIKHSGNERHQTIIIQCNMCKYGNGCQQPAVFSVAQLVIGEIPTVDSKSCSFPSNPATEKFLTRWSKYTAAATDTLEQSIYL